MKSTDCTKVAPIADCANFRFQIVEPRSGRRLAFWVRRRMGTVVSVPVTAWPEVAGWVLWHRFGLEAGAEEGFCRPGSNVLGQAESM